MLVYAILGITLSSYKFDFHLRGKLDIFWIYVAELLFLYQKLAVNYVAFCRSCPSMCVYVERKFVETDVAVKIGQGRGFIDEHSR